MLWPPRMRRLPTVALTLACACSPLRYELARRYDCPADEIEQDDESAVRDAAAVAHGVGAGLAVVGAVFSIAAAISGQGRSAPVVLTPPAPGCCCARSPADDARVFRGCGKTWSCQGDDCSLVQERTP